jgi:hypothetical protein
MVDFEVLESQAGATVRMNAVTARVSDAAMTDRHPIMNNRDGVSGTRLDIEVLDDLPVGLGLDGSAGLQREAGRAFHGAAPGWGRPTGKRRSLGLAPCRTDHAQAQKTSQQVTAVHASSYMDESA